MRSGILLFTALTLVQAVTAAGRALAAQAAEASWILPADEETALARSAAPAAVSDGATVWALREDGYRVAHEGGNGFHCMVRRLRHPRDVIPVCFNPPAAERVMPFWQGVVEEVMGGRSFREAWADAMGRLSDGELPLPEPGRAIAYMMSEETRLHNPETDQERDYFPHFMVFVPHLTDEEIGSSPDRVGGVRVPFVAFEGQPGAYLIVPTGQVGEGIRVPGAGAERAGGADPRSRGPADARRDTEARP